LTCKSLQSVATFLKFDWDTPHSFQTMFKARLFDYLGKMDIDGTSEWYTHRFRFGSVGQSAGCSERVVRTC
jgi:hypothetical protein